MAYADNSNASYDSTRRVYEAFLLRFTEWERYSDDSVAAWIMHSIVNHAWKKNTFKTRLSGIKHLFQVVLGLPFDTSPGSVLHLTSRAISRLGDDAEPKQPTKAERLQDVLSLLFGTWSEQLRSMLKSICVDIESVRIKLELAAWFTLSFACFFRAEEVAHLQWENAELDDLHTDGMPLRAAITLSTWRFFVYKTMTSSVRLEVSRSFEYDICAVSALSALIANKHSALVGSIFSVKVEAARKVLQVLASDVFKLHKNAFGLHSLRSGAACSADEAGINLARIMFMGRWRSAAVLAYLRGDKDGASTLILKAKRQGQGNVGGESRKGLNL